MQPGKAVRRNEGDVGGDEALHGTADEKVEAAVPDKPLVINLKRRGAWTNKPSVVGQFEDPRYAAHVRKGPYQPAVFDLSKPAQVKKMSALLARAHPSAGPEIYIQGEQKEVVGTKWLCCVMFQVIEYQQILVINSNESASS